MHMHCTVHMHRRCTRAVYAQALHVHLRGAHGPCMHCVCRSQCEKHHGCSRGYKHLGKGGKCSIAAPAGPHTLGLERACNTPAAFPCGVGWNGPLPTMPTETPDKNESPHACVRAPHRTYAGGSPRKRAHNARGTIAAVEGQVATQEEAAVSSADGASDTDDPDAGVAGSF